MAAARDEVAVGGAHGADEQLVLHRAPVDEQELLRHVRPVQRRQTCKARDRDALPLPGDGNGIGHELAAHDAPKTLQQAVGIRRFARQAQTRALAGGQREPDMRMGHGEALHHLGDGLVLGALRLEKFQPRRHARKQIAHLDARADIAGRRLHLAFGAAVDAQREGLAGAARARQDRQRCNRADGRQRLAAEAERADGEQVFLGQLRGGVPFHRQHQIVGRHAATIVGDADQRQAARCGDNLDLAGAGIERVLDQLLDDAGRPLHHLARGDTVDRLRR